MKIVYLDQNWISKLGMDDMRNVLDELSQILNRRSMVLGISFPHIYETVKASDVKRQSIFGVIQRLGWIQLKPLLFHIDAEFNNEFYRFMRLKSKDTSDPVGPIFPDIPDASFRELVSYASLNADGGRWITSYVNQSDKNFQTIANAVPADKSDRNFNLNAHRAGFLLNSEIPRIKKGERLNLPIQPTPNFSEKEFMVHFDWNSCPYSSCYTAFQFFRYADKSRKNYSGEIADTEHSVLGVLGCDYVAVDAMSAEVLKQMRGDGIIFKATVFGDLDSLIEHLQI